MWIVITLAATVFQILRTSEQHRLRSVLSVTEAGSVRYLYALPFALAGLGITSLTWDAAPTVHSRFVPIVIAAGVCQILGTICLLQSFRVRDFAVGTVYSKGEVILVAIASAVLIHEVPSPLGWVGVVVVFIGIVWLCKPAVADPGEAFTRLDPAALLGLAAGGLFALTSIGIRSASRAIDGGSDFEHALITLAGMLSLAGRDQRAGPRRRPERVTGPGAEGMASCASGRRALTRWVRQLGHGRSRSKDRRRSERSDRWSSCWPSRSASSCITNGTICRVPRQRNDPGRHRRHRRELIPSPTQGRVDVMRRRAPPAHRRRSGRDTRSSRCPFGRRTRNESWPR
ncbi:MAG: hypothetical protein R2710_00900 [Acidimicrobiales bacterium]